MTPAELRGLLEKRDVALSDYERRVAESFAFASEHRTLVRAREALSDAAVNHLAALLECVEALKLAHAELASQAGWSGAAGNWPLQEAETAARLALSALEAVK